MNIIASRSSLFELVDFDERQRKYDHLGIGKALEWCEARTTHWHQQLSDWCAQATRGRAVLPERPKLLFSWEAPNAAATWCAVDGGTIELHVAYALCREQAKYDYVIAHEMCHHFQHRLFPETLCTGMQALGKFRTQAALQEATKRLRKTEPHGETFYMLFHHGLGFYELNATHDYDCKQAMKLAPLLAVHANMLRLSREKEKV